MLIRKFLIYLFSILAAFSACSCGGAAQTGLGGDSVNETSEIQDACTEWVADHGLILLDVTKKNLPSAYSKYGVDGECVVIIGSSLTQKLEDGDRVISVNGNEVFSSCEIDCIVSALSAGDEIEMTVKRGERTVTVKYTLGRKQPESIKFK